MLNVGRVFLLAAALKYKFLLKLLFYYEVVIEILGHFLASKVNADADISVLVWMITTLLNFALLYSNFTLSVIASVLSLVTFMTGTTLVFGRDVNIVMAGKVYMLSIWLLFSLLTIHLVNFSNGLTHSKMQQDVEGNKNLIQELDVGVIVLNESLEKVEFSNRAAAYKLNILND